MAIHEELTNFAGRGLSGWNYLVNINGNGTDWSSTTTVATFQAVTNAKEGSSAFHETDKAIFRINSRNVETLNAMGIFTTTEITATNTTATGAAGFTDNDPTFGASYLGARGF